MTQDTGHHLARFALPLLALLASPAMAAESDDPIRLAINNWTSQIVETNIIGQLLEKSGHRVEYVTADSQLQYGAIASNDIDFQIEVWESSAKLAFDKAVSEGAVDYGTHAAVTREDWWFPDYVKELCPGLPDWKALDACAPLFATAETGGKGRFVGPPADWGTQFGERIKALHMNFVEIPVGQAATLWAELQAAADRKQPIVLFNWTPNFIQARYPGEFVEFPPYAPECLTDPSWGPNPESLYDCGALANSALKKAGSPELAQKWPEAAAFLRKVNFTNDEMAAAAAFVDLDGMAPEEAAAAWIEDNEAVWKPWTE